VGRIGSGVRISASFNQIFRRILSCGSQKGGYDIEGWVDLLHNHCAELTEEIPGGS